MKKIISSCILLFTMISVQAATFNVETAYTGSSRFDKAQVRAVVKPTLNLQTGVEATLANEHHAFKDPVYSVAVPVLLDFDLIKLHLRPFYYFKNKSMLLGEQNSQAFGLQSSLVLTLNQDTVNDIYTHAFIEAGFGRQRGIISYEDTTTDNRYYSQLAYTLGMEQAMYRAFNFRVMGTVFQYPDGVSKVSAFHSVMDQQELANLQTLEIVHTLPKYALSARMARLWADNGSSFYVGYRFSEYFTANSDHSIIIGNSFPITKQINLDLAYNHLRDVHNHNRRDIGQARLEISF